MNDENDRTIKSYESRYVEYVTATVNTVQGPMKEWLDNAVEGLFSDAGIFEIGSGFGRDAKYLQTKGYTVHCTDVTEGFITILKAQGLDTQYLNVLTDEIMGEYDLILANAVLLHFTDKDMIQVLRKIYEALKPDGRFAFSVKRGDGDEWSDNKTGLPRYFNYWQPEELIELLGAAGFKTVDIKKVAKSEGNEWLMVTTSK